jgi:hypothetical protein
MSRNSADFFIGAGATTNSQRGSTIVKSLTGGDGRLNANGSQIRLPFGKRIKLNAELATRDPDDAEQAGAEESERSRLRNRRGNSRG